MTSAGEFAKYLRVSAASLSQWMNDARVPVGDNLHRLAAKLGPKVYELVDQPPSLPDDPALRKVAFAWHNLSSDAQEKIMQIIDKSEAPQGERHNASGKNTVTTAGA